MLMSWFLFFKQEAAYENGLSLVGSEMCIGDMSWFAFIFCYTSLRLGGGEWLYISRLLIISKALM